MRSIIFTAVTVYLSFAAGCAGTAGSSPERQQKGTKDPILEKYESSFHPSDYDPDISLITKVDTEYNVDQKISDFTVSAQPETIAGFRIQVILTQDIEQAEKVRDDILKSFADNTVFIVYDLPYYKVRVGNFIEREEANESIRKLTGMGYKDAWVVPDKIVKNPLQATAPAADSTQRK